MNCRQNSGAAAGMETDIPVEAAAGMETDILAEAAAGMGTDVVDEVAAELHASPHHAEVAARTKTY